MYNRGDMFVAILHHYLVWHYSRAYIEFSRVWFNLMWFVAHFFSILDLMKSWLSPWKRMIEERKKGWDVEELLSSMVINIISRILGGIMRTVIIALGLASLIITFVGGILVYLIWTVAPALIIGLIIMGASYIIG
jgi:hypothetical protein